MSRAIVSPTPPRRRRRARPPSSLAAEAHRDGIGGGVACLLHQLRPRSIATVGAARSSGIWRKAVPAIGRDLGRPYRSAVPTSSIRSKRESTSRTWAFVAGASAPAGRLPGHRQAVDLRAGSSCHLLRDGPRVAAGRRVVDAPVTATRGREPRGARGGARRSSRSAPTGVGERRRVRGGEEWFGWGTTWVLPGEVDVRGAAAVYSFHGN